MIKTETRSCKSYFWSNFQCEICKVLFPFRFKTQNGLKYNLMEYKVNKDENYIVLESLVIEKPQQKIIYVVTPEYKN